MKISSCLVSSPSVSLPLLGGSCCLSVSSIDDDLNGATAPSLHSSLHRFLHLLPQRLILFPSPSSLFLRFVLRFLYCFHKPVELRLAQESGSHLSARPGPSQTGKWTTNFTNVILNIQRCEFFLLFIKKLIEYMFMFWGIWWIRVWLLNLGFLLIWKCGKRRASYCGYCLLISSHRCLNRSPSLCSISPNLYQYK